MFNFAHFNSKNTHITLKKKKKKKPTSVLVKMCKYTKLLCANDFFILFFSLPVGCSLIYLLLTTKKEKGRWGHVDSGLFDIIKN